jgi:aminomethyltransferase
MTEAPQEEVRRTPLEAEHVAAGARLGPFAGWRMPIEYRGTLAEHRAVREAVGLFDLTHLGEIIVEGEGAFDTLQRTFTNDLSKVEHGGAQYNLLLNERGGVVDDLIVYRIGSERYLVVPNAANEAEVLAALRDRARGAEVAGRDDLVLIAPQGPRSFDLVGGLFPDATSLEYMHCYTAVFGGAPAIVSRSGYTGERGFEIWVPPELAPELWIELLRRGESLGIEPCGLGARDTLRLEMGYPLHGNDIGPDRSPLEAGLSWAVALGKNDFPGRDAVIRQKETGIPSRLWGIRMRDRLIPRPHYAVTAGDEPAGETTSGTFSPTLRIGIAMAYLSPRDRFSVGDAVSVDIRGRRGEGDVVKPPFVDSSPK